MRGDQYGSRGELMPATERFTYRLGDTARWRVINLSSQAHPMHLYGFYFEVDSLGDGLKDTPIVAADRQPVVTQLMPPATTMTMTWTPERPGNWLFHCHLMHHVSAERRLAPRADTAHDHGDHDPSSGMAGMILGVTVLDGLRPRPPEIASAAPRKLTLTMQRHHNGSDQSFGFALTGDPGPSPSAPVSSPGPLLALRKGELVEITVVNRLGEPTALH